MTVCSETSAYKIQMPGNYSEETIQQNKTFLKSRISGYKKSHLRVQKVASQGTKSRISGYKESHLRVQKVASQGTKSRISGYKKTIILLSILCGSEIWSFTLRGINILQVLRSRKIWQSSKLRYYTSFISFNLRTSTVNNILNLTL